MGSDAGTNDGQDRGIDIAADSAGAVGDDAKADWTGPFAVEDAASGSETTGSAMDSG